MTLVLAFGPCGAAFAADWEINLPVETVELHPGTMVTIAGSIVNWSGSPLQLANVSSGLTSIAASRALRAELAAEFLATDLLIPASGYQGPILRLHANPDATLCLGGQVLLRALAGPGASPSSASVGLMFEIVDGDAPSIVLQPASMIVGCQSFGVLAVEAAGAGPFTYRWKRNGVSLSDHDSSGAVVGAATATVRIDSTWSFADGAYTVVVSNACGSTESAAATLTSAVDISDLANLLSHFGTESGATTSDGDLNGDGDVDLDDLVALLSNFSAGCP